DGRLRSEGLHRPPQALRRHALRHDQGEARLRRTAGQRSPLVAGLVAERGARLQLRRSRDRPEAALGVGVSARAPHARSLVLPRRSGGGMVRRAVRAHVACLLLTAGLLLPVAARAQEVGVEPEEAVWGTARILRIELLGTDGTSFEDLRHLVVVREGEPLSRRDIRRSVQRLYRTGRFANVEAYAEDRVGGVHLRFVLVPRKLLREVRVEGAPFLAGREPAALTDLAPGMDYADDLIEHGMLRLREVLARAGYERAQLQRAVDGRDDGGALHFPVTPHRPTRIARRRLSGERGDRAIVEAFALSRGDVLDLDRLERELDTLRDRYVKEGYFRAKVGRP